MPKQCVSNGGNAVGEAIGQYMETVVQEYIGDFFESLSLSVHYQNRKESYFTGRESKKLLLTDSYGTECQIDGVITTENMQPLVLIESKYIRYKNTTEIREVGFAMPIQQFDKGLKA